MFDVVLIKYAGSKHESVSIRHAIDVDHARYLAHQAVFKAAESQGKLDTESAWRAYKDSQRALENPKVGGGTRIGDHTVMWCAR